MSEFTDDTLIHLVIPAKQWDEMWGLYQKTKTTKKGQPGQGYENTLWYKLQIKN